MRLERVSWNCVRSGERVWSGHEVPIPDIVIKPETREVYSLVNHCVMKADYSPLVLADDERVFLCQNHLGEWDVLVHYNDRYIVVETFSTIEQAKLSYPQWVVWE